MLVAALLHSGVPSKFNWVKYGSRELVVKLSRIECYHYLDVVRAFQMLR